MEVTKACGVSTGVRILGIRLFYQDIRKLMLGDKIFWILSGMNQIQRKNIARAIAGKNSQ